MKEGGTGTGGRSGSDNGGGDGSGGDNVGDGGGGGVSLRMAPDTGAVTGSAGTKDRAVVLAASACSDPIQDATTDRVAAAAASASAHDGGGGAFGSGLAVVWRRWVRRCGRPATRDGAVSDDATASVPPPPLPQPPSAGSDTSSSEKTGDAEVDAKDDVACGGVASATVADRLRAALGPAGAAAGAALATASTALTLASPFLCLGAGLWALHSPSTFSSTITGDWVRVCLALLMLSMGLTLSLSDVVGAIKRPLLVLMSLVLEYGVAPLSAFTLGHIFRLSPALRAGLTLMGSVNGGQASNLCTYLAHGDVAASVLMTLTSSLLATGAIPALSQIYLSGVVEVDAGGLAASTAKLVLAPLAVGVATKAVADRVVRSLESLLPMVGIVAILIIVFGTTSLAAQQILDSWRVTLAPTALFHGLGFGIGYVVARWGARQRHVVAVAVAFESGFKVS